MVQHSYPRSPGDPKRCPRLCSCRLDTGRVISRLADYRSIAPPSYSQRRNGIATTVSVGSIAPFTPSLLDNFGTWTFIRSPCPANPPESVPPRQSPPSQTRHGRSRGGTRWTLSAHASRYLSPVPPP